MRRDDRKVVAVTGGASGIGLRIVQRLAAEGADVTGAPHPVDGGHTAR